MLTISSYVHKYTATVRKDKRYSSLSVQVLIFQSFFLKKRSSKDTVFAHCCITKHKNANEAK